MLLGIDPKVDYAFKRLFGRPQNLPLLQELLNAVLGLPPGQQVTELEILNPFNEKETEGDKLSVVDVKAQDQSGQRFHIEMQMLADRYFPQRILYYWSKLYGRQLNEREAYRDLRPVVSIAFVNNVLFPALEDYHLCFELRERRRAALFTPDLAIHLLELPKFTRGLDQLSDPLDAWLYFLRHAPTLDTEALPRQLATSLIPRAMEELIMVTQDELERERYEAREKVYRDALSFIVHLQEEVDEARERALREGMAAGIAKGQAEGMAQGIAAGRAEGIAAGELIGTIRLCQQLLQRPVTPPEELQALSLEQLQQLADQLKQEVAGPRPSQ